MKNTLTLDADERRRKEIDMINMTESQAKEFLAAFSSECHRDSSQDSSSDLYRLVCRKYLGEPLRELGFGEIFGERALDGETLRTASVVAITDCVLICLGAGEYNEFIKKVSRNNRNTKLHLIKAAFQGSDKLTFEELWQFQYLFNVTIYKLEKGDQRRRILEERKS